MFEGVEAQLRIGKGRGGVKSEVSGRRASTDRHETQAPRLTSNSIPRRHLFFAPNLLS